MEKLCLSRYSGLGTFSDRTWGTDFSALVWMVADQTIVVFFTGCHRALLWGHSFFIVYQWSLLSYHVLPTKSVLFADDTTFINTANSTLGTANIWFTCNKLKMNFDKNQTPFVEYKFFTWIMSDCSYWRWSNGTFLIRYLRNLIRFHMVRSCYFGLFVKGQLY